MNGFAKMTSEEMDSNAEQARDDFEALSLEVITAIGEVWQKWLMKCGHKRLGRLVVEYYRQAQEIDD